jgi:hypothetical protein
MSSAEDVEPGVSAGLHDERLSRAFDRVARLGIDVDPDDGLGARESAAVRAFTALNLDGAPAPTPPADRPLRPDAVLHDRPLTGEVPPVTTPYRVAGPEASPRPDAGTGPRARAVDHYLLDLVALALATGAFVTPWSWLFVVTVGALVGTTARSIADHGPRPGALVIRALRRALSWLRPRSAIWLPVIVARTVLLAIALPALAGGASWIVDQGMDGALAAARVSVWAHGFRTAAAIVCFTLVAGVGDARQRRAAQVCQASARLGTAAVVAAALALVVVASLVVAVVPQADAGRLAGADGLGWAPPRLRDNVDRVRDEVVTVELQAAAACLSARQGLTWRASYTARNPLADADVARLTAQDGTPAPGHLATAAAAVHNQLAPWVEAIELDAAGATLVVLDRAFLVSGRPLVDPAALPLAATTGAGVMADAIDAFDRRVALRCSAAPAL